MTQRTRWQYCQVEVGPGNTGQLQQFFPDRTPVVTDLHQNWPAMIAKLGEQGWELVNAFPNEGGRGRSPLTYVFRRPVGSGQPVGGSSAPSAAVSSPPPAMPAPPPQPEDDLPEEDDGPDFRPLDLP